MSVSVIVDRVPDVIVDVVVPANNIVSDRMTAGLKHTDWSL